MKRRTYALLVILASLVALPLATQESGFQIVVNSANQASSMSKADIAKLFLKRTTQWDQGLKVQPVDQAATRSVRQAFSMEIHGKEVSWIKSYWQKMIFSGRSTPPAEMVSDREVLEFVRGKVGAIGYVSAATSVGNGVKVLRATG